MKSILKIIDKYIYNKGLAYNINDKDLDAYKQKPKGGYYVNQENDINTSLGLVKDNRINVGSLLDQSKAEAKGFGGEGYYMAPQPGKPVILAFHANAELASRQYLNLYAMCKKNGYGLFCRNIVPIKRTQKHQRAKRTC